VTTGITVAIVGSPDVAKDLGKKGTASDMTLYNSAHDGHAVTVIEPTGFPEKFGSLLFALAMADRAVLAISAITREVAETAATLEMFDLPVEVRLGLSVGEDEVRRAFKGSPLEKSAMRELDPAHLRTEIDGWVAPDRPGGVQVRIDHAFPVKGVGAVALGVVRRGTLTTHEKLRLYPLEKVVEVRSIQVHDVDVRAARTGERVGIAIRGVEAEELARGQVLAPESSLTVASSVAGVEWRKSRYYRGNVAPGTQVQLLLGLQLVPAKIAEVGPTTITLTPDRPVAFEPGDALVVADLSPPSGPRIVGRANVAAP
jgi:selenocysteine-specific translation elongation factor